MSTNSTATPLTFSPEQAGNLSAVLHNAVRLISLEYETHQNCVFLGAVTGGLLETARAFSDQVETYLQTLPIASLPDKSEPDEDSSDQQEGAQP